MSIHYRRNGTSPIFLIFVNISAASARGMREFISAKFHELILRYDMKSSNYLTVVESDTDLLACMRITPVAHW